MHSRTLTSIALLAVLTTASIYCTSEQPPKTRVPETTPTFTPAPTFTPEPVSIYTPEPTAAAVPTPAPTITPAPSYLTQEMPPCTRVKGASVDPCEPVAATISSGGSLEFGSEPWNIRFFLDSDRGDGFIVAHVVLRGRVRPGHGALRCIWRAKRHTYLHGR